MKHFLLVCLLLPTAAALGGTATIEDTVPFRPLGMDGTYISGAVVLTAATTGTLLTTNASYAVTGLVQVCWDLDVPTCAQSPDGRLSLHLDGDTSLRLPTAAPVHATADHHLGFFADLSDDPRLEERGYVQSLAGPAHGGLVTIGPVAPIARQDPAAFHLRVPAEAGRATPVNAGSTVSVYNGTTKLAELNDRERVGFTGTPVVSPIAADGWVIPFTQGQAAFGRATRPAALAGLETDALEAFLDKLQDAADAQAPELSALHDLLSSTTLKEMLRGVILRLPAANATGLEEFPLFASFLSLQATGGQDVDIRGEAALAVRDGDVEGAQSLAGVWLIQLPWWGWLLWGLAIVAFALRIILHAPKTNERWDRYNWVGLVAGAAVLLVTFWLWDVEWARLIGTSAFTTGGPMWVLLALQAVTFLLVLGAVAWPLSILLRNGFMLARQGRFMNLGLPLALAVAFLLGITLVRAYLQLLLQEMPVG